MTSLIIPSVSESTILILSFAMKKRCILPTLWGIGTKLGTYHLNHASNVPEENGHSATKRLKNIGTKCIKIYIFLNLLSCCEPELLSFFSHAESIILKMSQGNSLICYGNNALTTILI